ncbi:cellulose biosynthesis cyclic di-GMP-binding regulatory protein BcsB [Falsirhodobacter deserti]|uniref:cellulose biosynthesis cyclic di-GMP-binding regulatory protein BcsB n=1 Tax=Falsirhodobacter deserti TaxID=1365611 RepID=UPI000FE40A24|nr:cellulose biosynthesis cyclic di-GMP-binding regulatory protein BcsB [Falsirhodobacter deserti]
MTRFCFGIVLASLLFSEPLLAQDALGAGGNGQILLPDMPASAPSAKLADPPATLPAPSTGPLPEIGSLARNTVTGTAQARTWNIGLRAPAAVPGDRIAMGPSFAEPGVLRLTGEAAEIMLALPLPAEASPPASFRLVLRSSVNNLPERSSVTVSVNGQEAGTWPLSSIGDWGRIDVPGTALRSGDNAIGLSLRQQHRIFCGPEASFDVWTEIDLPGSGVTVPAEMVPLDAANFRARLTSTVQRGQSIDVRMPEGVATESLAAVMTAIGRVMPEGGTTQVRSPYHPVDGAARRVGVSIREGTGAPAGATFLRSPQGALVMEVTDGPGLADVLAATLPPLPDEEERSNLEPGTTTSFKALGASQIVRNTRYASAEVPFTLPADWMNLSSQRGMLTLDYGYGEDLPQGSILLVKVNGETTVLLPLDVNGGKLQPPLPVRFPAHLLHGGKNAITFEMIVPGEPPTLPCPARETDMLVVLNSSTLNVPPSPPMTFGSFSDTLRAIGPADVTTVGSDASFLTTFIAQLALTPVAEGQGRLALARLPQDSGAMGPGLPLTREQIAQLFQTQTDVLPHEDDAPRFFRLDRGDDSESPARTSEPERPSQIAAWTARLHGLASPEGERLSDWILNRPGTAVLMAPQEEGGTWTLVADNSIAPEVLAQSFDTFRRTEAAQGARVALRGTDGTWQVWPPNPRPHVTGPISFREIFVVIGNFASWAPGYYALILLTLALLSTIPAFIYVIITRKGRTV